MTDEIFDRPNRATGPREVWECEESGRTFKTYADDKGVLHFLCEGTKCGRGIHIGCEATMPPGRYRIRTLDEKPWPPKTRVEKRWYNLYPSGMYESRAIADSVASFDRSACIPLEVTLDENDKVLRVLKDGE